MKKASTALVISLALLLGLLGPLPAQAKVELPRIAGATDQPLSAASTFDQIAVLDHPQPAFSLAAQTLVSVSDPTRPKVSSSYFLFARPPPASAELASWLSTWSDARIYQEERGLRAKTQWVCLAWAPHMYTDPTGEYLEAPLEVLSLTAGIASFGYNMNQGHYGAALWDLFGVGVDTAGLVVPGTLAVGASTQAVRAGQVLSRGQKVYLGAQAVQHTGDMAQGLFEGTRAFQQGHHGWGSFYFGMSALGFHGARANAMELNVPGGYSLARMGGIPQFRLAKEAPRDAAGRFLPHNGDVLPPGRPRAERVRAKLRWMFGSDAVQDEFYLLNSVGERVVDPLTGEARRLDHVIIQNGQARFSIEVTSKTASKSSQLLKEQRIRRAGGTFVRDRLTGQLVDLRGVPNRLIRVE